jgi:hypothetical protein
MTLLMCTEKESFQDILVNADAAAGASAAEHAGVHELHISHTFIVSVYRCF